ncbi:MAG: HD domain-containing protein [Lachnospiraceae bacterium]|nr:HD domain-containing protein [Lachnospiraceae bacterium]
MKNNGNEIKRKIKDYGSDILGSTWYKKAFSQTHHGKTSVGRHSIRVAEETLKVCALLSRLGISVDEKIAVRAALLHDLGILGRDQKFSSQYEMSRRHPLESLVVAKEFEPHIDERIEQAITRHMFPVFSKPPTKAEAIAVCIADKVASVRDIVQKNETFKKSRGSKHEISGYY